MWEYTTWNFPVDSGFFKQAPIDKWEILFTIQEPGLEPESIHTDMVFTSERTANVVVGVMNEMNDEEKLKIADDFIYDVHPGSIISFNVAKVTEETEED